MEQQPAMTVNGCKFYDMGDLSSLRMEGGLITNHGSEAFSFESQDGTHVTIQPGETRNARTGVALAP